MEWVPPWLGKAYCGLYGAFGRSEFALDDALTCLHASRERGRVILSELARRGYLRRVGRGRYKAKNPTMVVLGVMLGPELPSLKQRVYEPLLEEVLAKLFERFGEDLVSVVLYGSVARGVARPTSDMDLFVVIQGLPFNFYDRATLISDIVRRLHEPKMRLWRDGGRYTNIDILPFTPEEAAVLRPLYLDFLFDAMLLHDRGGFMHEVLEQLRKRLRELGGRRVTMPSGKWYWLLSQPLQKGIEIQL